MTVEPPPRRSTAVRVVLGCLIAVGIVALLIVGSCGAYFFSRVRTVNQMNKQNRAAAVPVIGALGLYKKGKGRYPESLCDANLAPLHFAQYTYLYYSSSEKGDRYWFAFTYFEPHFVLPSDDVQQYSSASNEWSMKDINDAEAKYDARWAESCQTTRGR